MSIVTIFLFVFFISAFFSIFFFSIRFGITPSPSGRKVKKTLFFILSSKIFSKLSKERENFTHKKSLDQKKIFELGSGWGGLAFLLGKRFSHHRVYAYEISPVPYLFSFFLKNFMRKTNVKIFRKDFFCVSLKEASIVMCYLYPKAMKRLKEKFEKELRNGALVISHTFAIPGWISKKIYVANDIYKTKIYLYKFKKEKNVERNRYT